MKIVAVMLAAIMLTGCGLFRANPPGKPKFPDPIKELTMPCPDLKTVEGDKVAITELLKTVVSNYTLYHDCSLKNEGWNKWYKEQKEIYDKIK